MKSIQLLLTGFGGLIATAAAQTTASKPLPLDEMVVRAEREKALTVPTTEDSREELAKTPGGTEVIDSERYLTGRASTMADTFALSPGVVAQSRFGSDESRISIRGSGLQRTFHGRGIRVLQDGIPINLADGGFDMQSLEPTATDHINIWRGGNALAYGSSTLGGAIDYISRNGRNSPGGLFRIEAGSYDYLRATVAGGLADETTDAYASFTQQYQEGFRDHAEQNNQRLFTNFGWKISDTIENRLYFSAVNTDSELPGALSKDDLENDPSKANPDNIAKDQHRDFQLYRIANKTSFVNGDNTWDLTAAWTYKDLDHPIFQTIDQVSNDALLGVTFVNSSDLFAHENNVRAGLLFTYGKTRAAQFLNLNGERGAKVLENDQIATNFEAFAEDQFTLGKGFSAIIGGSYAHNRRELDQILGTPDSYDYSYNQFAPKVGMRWDGNDLQVFANVSGSYEPPSFSETYTANTARDAQTATSFEIGTRGMRNFFRWDVTAYHAEIENELLTIVDPITNSSTTTNADQTTHTGIEVGAEIDLLGQSWKDMPDHRVVFRSAWTYGKFEFDRHSTDTYDYSGNKIAGLPPHLIRGELVWENSSGWYAGPTFEWVPVESYIDHRNTTTADPYALVGFKLGQRKEKGISWFIEAKNLTDEHYASTYNVLDTFNPSAPTQYLPGDGRSVYAGLQWNW
jgi:iron complex outermembrane recepter protein